MYRPHPHQEKVGVDAGGNNMNFKSFFENYQILDESNGGVMGDFTEVIFAIGLLHYTLKKSVSSEDILKTLNEIPSVPFQNVYTHDNYDVALYIDGKKSLSHLVGGAISGLEDTQKNQINEIINKVSTNIPKLKTIKKVDRFIEQSRSIPDANKFIITIKSAGSKTAQQSDVKADVVMEIVAKDNIKIPSDIKKIVYSIKYDKTKVTESSIFNVVLRLGNAFKLPLTRGLEDLKTLPYNVGRGSDAGKWRDEVFYNNPEYKKLSTQENHLFYYIRLITSDELNNTDKMAVVNQFLKEFNDEMVVKEKQQPAFSNILYNFLEKEIFGNDIADIVKVDSKGLKELDIETYNQIKNSHLVDFSMRPHKAKNRILSFEAVGKDNSRFMLFWIDTMVTGQTQIHIGDDLLK
jgi:hypothetical protein